MDLRLRAAGARPTVDADAIRERFHEGFARVWHGEAEQDGFNGLIIAAGLDWREVTMLRAVARYLRQAGIPFSDRYMEETLLAPPRASRRRSCALFRARFDPARRARRAPTRCAARDRGARSTRSTRLDEDRILRGFLVGRAGDAAHELLAWPGAEAVPVVQARPARGSR